MKNRNNCEKIKLGMRKEITTRVNIYYLGTLDPVGRLSETPE